MRFLTIRKYLLAMVAWSVASTALADKPVKDSFSFVDLGFPIVECEGFDVLSDSTVEGFFLLSFDEDGNLVSVRDHTAVVDDVWYNSTNPEIKINAGPGQVQNRSFDLVGDPPTVLASGSVFRATLPGYGVVLLNAGYTLLDFNTREILIKRGPSILDEGASDLICALLSS